jgi:SagB-type dehydrogenase family enzyme
MPLMKALSLRRTERSFSEKPLDDATLSSLLWAAWGINRPDSGRRTAPSAVNWQEIDVYAAMPDGLFFYNADDHVLEPVMEEDLRKQAGKQGFVKKAPVVLIYVADRSRMARDDEARDFYSAIDTGYISQNVYLFCAAHELNTVAVGWVEKEKLAEAMKLKPEQRVILTQPVGHPE